MSVLLLGRRMKIGASLNQITGDGEPSKNTTEACLPIIMKENPKEYLVEGRMT